MLDIEYFLNSLAYDMKIIEQSCENTRLIYGTPLAQAHCILTV